ncbi:hypothetical protein M758_UG054500 [Ceratodon purpureus]|nr:hypothetical protein M758_UG054500 [Ceratodon purpureus]
MGTAAISVSYAIFRLPISCCSLRWRLIVILLQSVFERYGRMVELVIWMRNIGLVTSRRNTYSVIEKINAS